MDVNVERAGPGMVTTGATGCVPQVGPPLPHVSRSMRSTMVTACQTRRLCQEVGTLPCCVALMKLMAAAAIMRCHSLGQGIHPGLGQTCGKWFGAFALLS